MAYSKYNFYCARGLSNCEGSPTAAVIHTYTSSDSSVETANPNYAPPYFGFSAQEVRDGDYIFFTLSDIEGIVRIIDAKNNIAFPFILAPQEPPLQQTFTEQSNQFEGIWASPISTSLLFGETGRICQLTIPSVLDSSTISGEIVLSSTAFRNPSIDTVIPLIVVDNGVDMDGKLTFLANGNITISPLNATFSGSGISGFYGRTFSYNLFI